MRVCIGHAGSLHWLYLSFKMLRSCPAACRALIVTKPRWKSSSGGSCHVSLSAASLAWSSSCVQTCIAISMRKERVRCASAAATGVGAHSFAWGLNLDIDAMVAAGARAGEVAAAAFGEASAGVVAGDACPPCPSGATACRGVSIDYPPPSLSAMIQGTTRNGVRQGTCSAVLQARARETRRGPIDELAETS